MYSILAKILVISFAVICMNNSIEAKKLKLVLVVFRHGDRTPVFTYPTDPYGDEAKYWPDSYEMLTKEGKQRMYSLGKYMRKRYKGFLSDSPREAYVRSSAKHRCLETASVVMAGLYPPTGRWQWNSDLGRQWQPSPINTVPLETDGLLYPESNCPKAFREKNRIFNSKEVQKFWTKHEKLRKYVEIQTKMKFKHYHTFRDLINAFEIQKYHKYTLPSWVNQTVYDSLQEFYEKSFTFDSNSDSIIKFRAGLLLKDMSKHLNECRNNRKFLYKIFLYSTHDTQLTVFLRALDVYNFLSPPYGSTVFIELYETNENSRIEHRLEVHYLNVTESEKTVTLYPKGCRKATNICLLNDFLDYIHKYIPNDWENDCKDDSFVKRLIKFEL